MCAIVRTALPICFVLLVMGSTIGFAQDDELQEKIEEARDRVAEIGELGAKTIVVRSLRPAESDEADRGSEPLSYGLSRANLTRLSRTIPTIDSAVPCRELVAQIGLPGARDQKPYDVKFVGCISGYLEEHQLEISRGRFLNNEDVKAKQNVCVLSAEIAEELFRFKDPIGRTVFLPESRIHLKVVGVLEPREAKPELGEALPAKRFSQEICLPITTMRSRLGDTQITKTDEGVTATQFELTQITLRVSDAGDVEPTAELVKAILFGDDAERDDIAVAVPLQMLAKAKETLAELEGR
jgi:putative ABC transport system permease protein